MYATFGSPATRTFALKKKKINYLNSRTANVFVPARQQRGGGRSTPPLEKKVSYLRKSDFLCNEIGTISCEIIRAIF